MDSNELSWQPSCSMEMLRLKSCALAAVRQFFRERGYCEVETPLLSGDIVVDAHLEPMEVLHSGADRRLFLQTSPEAGMKRLLAAGSGSLFQVTRSFRGHETGSLHNPEFTMVEWYGVDTDWRDQLRLTEDLVRCVWTCARGFLANAAGSEFRLQELPERPFSEISYDAAFNDCFGISALDASLAELQALVAEKTSVNLAGAVDVTHRDLLLNLLLAECVEARLGNSIPQFLHSYPISQAALAVQTPADERTALRFELYWNGLELCNGYQELTDPVELRRRDEQQNAIRVAGQSQQLPGAELMLAAMQSGLPKCSGVAMGFDRLLMSVLKLTDIRQVISFPIESA